MTAWRAGKARSVLPGLYREGDAELGFAPHHASIGFVHFGNWKFLDHGADAGEFSEAQRVFGLGGDAGSPTLNGFAPADHEPVGT
jgi:hypothetical protein